MAEVYDKPTVSAAGLAWGTSISGSIAEWGDAKRAGGFYYGEPIPAENLNYRWNLLGDWVQYTEAPVQRRFDSLSDGIGTISTGEVCWADDGYRGHFTSSYTQVSSRTLYGTISDVHCDSEFLYHSIGQYVLKSSPSTGTEDSEYEYDLTSDVTSVHSNGGYVFATVSGSTFYRLDREDSGVAAVPVVVTTGKNVKKFKSNGYHGLGCDGSTQYVPTFLGVNTTPFHNGDYDATGAVEDIAVGDLYGCTVGHPADEGGSNYNVHSITLVGGAYRWKALAGGAATIAYAVCTDADRFYVLHEREGSTTVACYNALYGTELWTADTLPNPPAAPTWVETNSRCFVDDRYLYVYHPLSPDDGGLYVLNKLDGSYVQQIGIPGEYSMRDSDGWNLYSIDTDTNSTVGYSVGGGPKQFVKGLGTYVYRRPFAKLGLPV